MSPEAKRFFEFGRSLAARVRGEIPVGIAATTFRHDPMPATGLLSPWRELKPNTNHAGGGKAAFQAGRGISRNAHRQGVAFLTDTTEPDFRKDPAGHAVFARRVLGLVAAALEEEASR